MKSHINRNIQFIHSWACPCRLQVWSIHWAKRDTRKDWRRATRSSSFWKVSWRLDLANFCGTNMIPNIIYWESEWCIRSVMGGIQFTHECETNWNILHYLHMFSYLIIDYHNLPCKDKLIMCRDSLLLFDLISFDLPDSMDINT